jgi:hypothetical protein
MKNDFAIIKSNLTKEEKQVAELILENYRLQKGNSIKKAIAQYRADANEFGWTYTERQLQNACAFHNVFDEYVKEHNS